MSPRLPHKVTEKERENILKLYTEDKFGFSTVGRILRIPCATVTKVIKNSGIPVRSREEAITSARMHISRSESFARALEIKKQMGLIK